MVKQNLSIGLKKGIKKSNKLYSQALKMIASGTNTFSRAPGVFPDGASPKFLEKQKGARVWDVDGNQYIDMVMGCGPVTIGHSNEKINKAVQKQLNKGILFSMLNPLEVELAKLLIQNIPSAEMVKLSKNASDVCAASVRLARFVTGKKMIFCYGYHGFHDWYVGTTDRNGGIPQEIRNLTKVFDYGDVDKLEKMFKKYKNQVAAVIMEPVIGQRQICTYDTKYNKRKFAKPCKNCNQIKTLKRIRNLAHKNKALFILDECISGFRFNIGGAQNYFGVDADLSIFGKGLTNGMPLGVLTGKRKYMKHFDKVFLSSTYAPEALTLAAAVETIKFLKKYGVINSLWKKGEYLEKNFLNIIKKHSLEKNISLAGYPVRLMVNTHDDNGVQNSVLATLYQQEMFKNGILCFSGVLMLSYELNNKDLKLIVNAFDKTCEKVAKAIKSKKPIKNFLRCKPMSPVFKGLRERNAVSN